MSPISPSTNRFSEWDHHNFLFYFSQYLLLQGLARRKLITPDDPFRRDNRNQQQNGLEEGLSTRLLFYSGNLMLDEISLATVCASKTTTLLPIWCLLNRQATPCMSLPW
ncbi:MAG: CbbQ/NirQ/NorQ C-terminal domain-containing protein [Desulfobacteraceae bacterium]|nr:CbbQ/NirQ/NorQ C-terminal domain-containing protein [Desulfobacteraceae bacterium]